MLKGGTQRNERKGGGNTALKAYQISRAWFLRRGIQKSAEEKKTCGTSISSEKRVNGFHNLIEVGG